MSTFLMAGGINQILPAKLVSDFKEGVSVSEM